MNALKKIISVAKAYKKKYPKKYKTWTEYVKYASSIYNKNKKVGATKIIERGENKKAKVTKTLKRVRSKKGTFKGYKVINGTHKDTKSHNVNIRVVSGISGIKSAAKKLLLDKYGNLAAKKIVEKTKRGKKNIQKEMSVISSQLRKIEKF